MTTFRLPRNTERQRDRNTERPSLETDSTSCGTEPTTTKVVSKTECPFD
jgi:hypothetical protein